MNQSQLWNNIPQLIVSKTVTDPTWIDINKWQAIYVQPKHEQAAKRVLDAIEIGMVEYDLDKIVDLINAEINKEVK